MHAKVKHEEKMIKSLKYTLYGAVTVHKARHAIFGQFLPPPLSHFVTHAGTPPKVSYTSRNPQIFSRPSAKNQDKSPLYKFCLNRKLNITLNFMFHMYDKKNLKV